MNKTEPYWRDIIIDPQTLVDELFESLCSRYQDNLETSMRESDFIFDLVQLMYYKCHKVNFRRSGSYSDWIKKNLKNKSEK